MIFWFNFLGLDNKIVDVEVFFRQLESCYRSMKKATTTNKSNYGLFLYRLIKERKLFTMNHFMSNKKFNRTSKNFGFYICIQLANIVAEIPPITFKAHSLTIPVKKVPSPLNTSY